MPTREQMQALAKASAALDRAERRVARTERTSADAKAALNMARIGYANALGDLQLVLGVQTDPAETPGRRDDADGVPL